ncbi:MAG: hypothetical protein ACLR7U_03785 [Ruthenibacterium lactatiformans]
MDAVLLQRLAQITEEERELLQGRGVDRALYASGVRLRWMRQRCGEGKLMSSAPSLRTVRAQPQLWDHVYAWKNGAPHHGDALVTLEAGELCS